jgi:PAS domain S-box-containing protein
MLGDITCASSFSQDSVFGIAIWCLWGFLSVNDVFCNILGYERDEFLSGDMFFPQLFPAREVQERRMNCLQFAFSKDEVHVENPATFVRKDGNEINCIFTVRAARDHNNVPLYFVGHLIPLDPVLLASTTHEGAWNPQ